MFTGIIETIGTIEDIIVHQGNIDFIISSDISSELKVDQSVSHNGVCLTVTKVEGNIHHVTAIDETLKKTALRQWSKGSKINLERAMLNNARFDGHIVQGHVDQTGVCESISDENGSWLFTFSYQPRPDALIVDKGSICIDGVSLTVVNASGNQFSVAIIPYTFEHTVFQHYISGDLVNLEFDIIGKYFSKYFAVYASK